MNLWNAIREFLGGGARAIYSAPLRNRSGGKAWIKPFGQEYGADALAGRVVTTQFRLESRKWVIDPPQALRLTCDISYGLDVVRSGTCVSVVGLNDDLLEPMREVGDGERDESAAWLPPVPTDAKASKRAPA